MWVEFGNAVLGLIALWFAVELYRRSRGTQVVAWRWVIAAIGLFAISETLALAELAGREAAQVSAIAYRVLQAGFVACMMVGVALKLRLAAKESEERLRMKAGRRAQA